MPRIKLTVAYVGTNFSGWQLQKLQAQHKNQCPRTVQGELEKCLEKVCCRPVRVHGAGRTDSGVHAHAQCAHIEFAEGDKHLATDWRRALNALLPEDVAVLDARVMPDEFHARFSAVKKHYCYTLWCKQEYVAPHRRPFVLPVAPISDAGLTAMNEAAKYMCGVQDYASFQNVGTDIQSSVRNVMAVYCTQNAAFPHELMWHFEADGFLKQMVRNMMGLLLWVGKGKVAARDVPTLIAACNRNALPPTLAPQGLCLEHIDYGAFDTPDATGALKIS